MESLVPLLLVLNFVFLAAFAISLVLWSKRGARVAELEGQIEHGGSAAQAAHRETDEVRRELAAERRRLSDLEAEWADYRKASEAAGAAAAAQAAEIHAGLVADRDRGIAKLEPLAARLREAEAKVSQAELECARLRTDALQAQKRMEGAEITTSGKVLQFERLEVSLVEKEKALLEKQATCADQERDLREKKETIVSLVAERDRLAAMERALAKRLEESEEACRSSDRDRQRLNEELAATTLALRDAREQLDTLRRLADEAAAAGGEGQARVRVLEEQIVELESRLSRKESALADLEAAFTDTSRETTYAAHRHMEWTLNHFDPQSITFKFLNEGAKVFLVGAETNYPELRYELETGHDLPRDKEARLKLAIRKADQLRMKELPEEFDLTVLYALHVFPIHFKIRPRAGQRIERVR